MILFEPTVCCHRSVLHPDFPEIEYKVDFPPFKGIKKSSRVKQKPRTVESVTTDKEHVNVVFIGHVGEFLDDLRCIMINESLLQMLENQQLEAR